MMGDFFAAQVRAGRGFLGWTREVLAERSGVTARALARVEAAEVTPHARTVVKIKAAFEAAGVVLADAHDPEGCIIRKASS